jgi:hypothetical protein
MLEDTKVSPEKGDGAISTGTAAGAPSTLTLFSSNPEQVIVSVEDRFSLLFPTGIVDLTPEEQKKVQVYQEARLVLGSAGTAPMRCAGELCPIASTCPLMKMKKAPLGETCPFEANYVVNRFAGWMRELMKTEATMTETERSSIGQLVVIDLQEQRCLAIMSEGKAASMTDLSVKEVDLQTGEALSYEKIVHANMQILQELRTTRRMLLDDMEKTEKAKTRKLKTMQGHTGKDLATRQSATGDAVRDALHIVDADFVEIKKK